MPQKIAIMLKPASSECNLRCKYCFYNAEACMRESFSYGMMSENTVVNAIKKAFEFTKGEQVYISFQGGEPLLRGKEFFRLVASTLKAENKYNSPVILAVQTNGTLIDEEWCAIFSQNDILVGVSLDGDRRANEMRCDKNGEPSFRKALCAIELLKKYHIKFNILTVVTKDTAINISSVYKFFTARGYNFMQFIPCLAPLDGKKEDFYMNGRQYGEYLVELFKLYYGDYKSGKQVSVRQLDNFVRLCAKLPAEQCGMNGYCSHQFVIEGDGEVYPCDFYCLDEYKMGNINDKDFLALSQSPVSTKFIKESLVLEERCKACKFFMLCQGGCKRERNDVPQCEAYNYFFTKMLPYVEEMSKSFQR